MGSIVFGIVLFLQKFLFIKTKTILVETFECKDLTSFLSLDAMDVSTIYFSRLLVLCFHLLLPDSLPELDKKLKKMVAQAAKATLIKSNE